MEYLTTSVRAQGKAKGETTYPSHQQQSVKIRLENPERDKGLGYISTLPI